MACRCWLFVNYSLTGDPICSLQFCAWAPGPEHDATQMQEESGSAAWILQDLPHDWAIQTLPRRSADSNVQVIQVRDGHWRFHPGDSPTCTYEDYSNNASCFCHMKFDGSCDEERPLFSRERMLQNIDGLQTEDLQELDQNRTSDSWLWSLTSYDDSHWLNVTVPHDWREPPANYTSCNSTAWYRKHLPPATAEQVRICSSHMIAAM